MIKNENTNHQYSVVGIFLPQNHNKIREYYKKNIQKGWC